MTRFRLTIEYDGAGFVGWQRQANGLAVQQALEQAVAAFSGETVTVIAAGRTDAGVHALGQVVHVDLERPTAPFTLLKALNAHLRPQRVSVVVAAAVPADFHARFSARGRTYLYRILNRSAPPTLDSGRVWHVAKPLNVRAMQQGARFLIGRHDFTTFRSTHCQAASPVKTLAALTVKRQGDEVLIRAKARSFLHNQVRSMVGTLKRVGDGGWVPRDVATALAARDRAASGPVAPAHGLYLVEVAYGRRSAQQPRRAEVEQKREQEFEDDQA